MILEILLLLQSSELVAKFQSRCGVRRIPPSLKSNAKHHEESSRLFHVLFNFGSLIGDEEFLIVFFGFLHWNVDPIMTRRTMMLWTLTLYIGQTLKGFIQIPRPTAPPVVYLETRHLREYGFPSTHAGGSLAISYGLATFLRYPLLLAESNWLPSRVVFCVVWTGLVSLSRLYKGVHSMLDILAGLVYSSIIIYFFVPVIPMLDQLLSTGLHIPQTTEASKDFALSASEYSLFGHCKVALLSYVFILGLGMLTWFIPQSPNGVPVKSDISSISQHSNCSSQSEHIDRETHKSSKDPDAETDSKDKENTVRAGGVRTDCISMTAISANFSTSTLLYSYLTPKALFKPAPLFTQYAVFSGLLSEWICILVRVTLGGVIIGTIFLLGKPLLYRWLCRMQGLDSTGRKNRYLFSVELPLIFFLYTAMIVIGFGLLPVLFNQLSCQLGGPNYFPIHLV